MNLCEEQIRPNDEFSGFIKSLIVFHQVYCFKTVVAFDQILQWFETIGPHSLYSDWLDLKTLYQA